MHCRSTNSTPDRRPAPVLERRLAHYIAELDAILSRQVNAIIHHPSFQRLEASWRGLRRLAEQAAEDPHTQVRMLSVTWSELARDAGRAIEFDQSQLFRRVYGEHFGTPGGEPFSVLIGDYQIRPQPTREHPIDDVAVLSAIAGVAAAAFCPFVTAAHPTLLGLDRFGELERAERLDRATDPVEFASWRSFRAIEDARFVALTVPRVLVRHPYRDEDTTTCAFPFHENASRLEDHLWGSAAYAFAAVLMRAFARSGWLADIRGTRPGYAVGGGDAGGGLVDDLSVASFSTDRAGVAPKGIAEVIITDRQEKALSELGFVPLCRCHDTAQSAFYATASAQAPKTYEEPAAATNARISSMLHYILCVSRFGHYLKVLARDKIGSTMTATDLQCVLHRWLTNYVSPDELAAPAVKARYPLREARVEVRERPDRPGAYACTIHLWPHFQLDALTASVRLRAELVAANATPAHAAV